MYTPLNHKKVLEWLRRGYFDLFRLIRTVKIISFEQHVTWRVILNIVTELSKT